MAHNQNDRDGKVRFLILFGSILLQRLLLKLWNCFFLNAAADLMIVLQLKKIILFANQSMLCPNEKQTQDIHFTKIKKGL